MSLRCLSGQFWHWRLPEGWKISGAEKWVEDSSAEGGHPGLHGLRQGHPAPMAHGGDGITPIRHGVQAVEHLIPMPQPLWHSRNGQLGNGVNNSAFAQRESAISLPSRGPC